MSTWIDQTDYARVIPNDILARLMAQATAPTTLLDDCENIAIEEIRGYLSARYDVAAIFATTGNNRNPLVLKYALDMAVYHLYHQLESDQVPELRKDAFDAAKQWLRRVQQQELNPPDLPLVTDGTKDYIQYGSNPKRNNQLS